MNNSNKEAILSSLWQIDKQLATTAFKVKDTSELKKQGEKLASLEEELINIIQEIEETL